ANPLVTRAATETPETDATTTPASAISPVSGPEGFDIIIEGARAIDPESGFDFRGVNIGITGSTITKISFDEIEPSQDTTIIDATGLVASPGFVDILSYNPNSYGSWYKIADGVTTNLAMHGGAKYPRSWYSRYTKARPPVNFGAGYFYNSARLGLGIGPYKKATPAQIEQLTEKARAGLRAGALGIGMSIEYAPAMSYAEITAMGRVAAETGVPVFFHLRHSDMELPGTNTDAVVEVIKMALETGAAIHIDHLNSTGGTFSIEDSLAIIETAIEAGVDITACTYPYPFWATYLNSARFAKGWQKKFRIGYSDLQLGGTTEMLTPDSFKKYQQLGKLAVAYAIPEEEVAFALRSPRVMLGSDGMLSSSLNHHPRAAGAYARTLGHYVREKKTLSLIEALRKMTIMPVKRLEARSPALALKGRLQVGKDADIVLFNPETVIDKATVEKPNQYSTGIEYVIVNGQIAKDPKGLKMKVRAGKAIRSEIE
ncbi:MAG: amidohydrolase family protein, partial [Proteobacteria bacterium]|nr:amidohydrolase family protein [Pseudomonadota bacterium]